MAFVNEYIASADAERYDLESINETFIVGGTHAHDWTIDRDRDLYLRVVARGREEMAGCSTWTLYRCGDLIVVDLDCVQHHAHMGRGPAAMAELSLIINLRDRSI
jgi:hypothetical protein